MDTNKKSWLRALFAYADGEEKRLALSVVLSVLSVMLGLAPFYCMYRLICLFVAGEAMAALCRTLGFGPENAMCFGDGTNDISMLRLAGVGVAMENAEPCVKEAADVVTASCDEDGVAQMIERTLL